MSGHLAFPFAIGRDGRAATVGTLPDHVAQELHQLILTALGERLFLPEFGTNVKRLVFENIDETTAGMTKGIITDAVSRWLGERVTIEELEVRIEESALIVDLSYRPAGADDTRLLRFSRKGEA
jgi:hypothetical protein